MGIKQITPTAQINAMLTEQRTRIEQAIIRNLSYVGERCVVEARSTNSYQDQTGNLRSSIGYVIGKDGKVIQGGGFGVVGKGSVGAKEGEAFARKVLNDFPRGIVLVIVAGMNYATYVSAKGYDVLESAELLAQKLVPTMLRQLEL